MRGLALEVARCSQEQIGEAWGAAAARLLLAEAELLLRDADPQHQNPTAAWAGRDNI